MNKPKPRNTAATPQNDRGIVEEALRQIRSEQEDLVPQTDPRAEGPGAPPEGAAADAAATTIHSGQTTRGSYATDSSTGAGRYLDHLGTFSSEPVDPDQPVEPIDPKTGS